MLSGDFWPSVGVLTAGLALILNFCCFNDVQGHSSFKSHPEDLKAPFSQPTPLIIQSWLSFHTLGIYHSEVATQGHRPACLCCICQKQELSVSIFGLDSFVGSSRGEAKMNFFLLL